MCGITGIWKFDDIKVTKEEIETFNNSLQHRGPDGFGTYIDDMSNIALGHRRLSILDLSESGKQPMPYLQNRYWITYNGEVFNFIELKVELIKLGYTFKSESDTEIILAAYHEWKEDCLQKFNGMWAFAIFDKQEQNLFLARDRFGIKPLYYSNCQNNSFVFASETISFKSLKGFERKIDNSNLSRVLQNPFALEGFGYTIFEDIFQILPGHYLNIKKNQPSQQMLWWHTLDHLSEIPKSYEDQVLKFRELFEDACKIRLRSDVSIASALSGGLDSSSVYGMIHNIMSKSDKKERTPNNWQKAFVVTFPGSNIDEREYAEKVVEYTNGDANYITQDYSELIEKTVKSTKMAEIVFQSPIFVASDIYKAMQKEGIKVSMDGHGVDEMLFGYPHLVNEVYADAEKMNNEILASEISDIYKEMNLPILTPKKEEKIKKEIKTDSIFIKIGKKIYRKITNVKSEPITTKKTTDWIKNIPQEPLISLSNKKIDLSKLSAVDKVVFENFHTTVLPTILRNFDRASMQSGVEIRMPFMDYRLVSYVFSLPTSSKIGGGYTKRILRDSIKGLIPESIRQRKLKFGLGSPLPEWFSGKMSTFITNIVNSPEFINSEVWDGQTISDFAKEKIEKKSWIWNDCLKFWPYIDVAIINNYYSNKK